MKLAANVDRCDEAFISGWAFYSDEPEKKLQLDVLYRGKILGTCVANEVHEGLPGGYGFTFAIPLIPKGDIKNVSIRISGTLEIIPTGITDNEGEGMTPSPFGGMWIDRYDFIRRLAEKCHSGEISDEISIQIFRFVRDGYVIFRNAVPSDLIDDLNEEIEEFWKHPPDGMLIETFEPDRQHKYIAPNIAYRGGVTKLLDLFAFSSLAQKVTAAPKIMEFLSAIFEDRPKASQGLYFWKGSEQAIHKDTAYVKVDTQPMHLTASWLALEDVHPGTGELEYYIGSHRAPDYLFGEAHKWMETTPHEHDAFLSSLHKDADVYHHPRSSFLANKGDVLIWHADLAHGGSAVLHPGVTRKSLVTHFTGERNDPFFRRSTDFKTLKTENCVFVSQFLDVKDFSEN